MLIGVDTNRRRTRHHCHFAFPPSVLAQPVVRRGLHNQLGLTVLQLRHGACADIESPCVFGELRRLRQLPHLVTRAVLVNKGRSLAHPMRRLHLNAYGSTLSDGRYCRSQFHNRPWGSGCSKDSYTKKKSDDDEKKDFAHEFRIARNPQSADW